MKKTQRFWARFLTLGGVGLTFVATVGCQTTGKGLVSRGSVAAKTPATAIEKRIVQKQVTQQQLTSETNRAETNYVDNRQPLPAAQNFASKPIQEGVQLASALDQETAGVSNGATRGETLPKPAPDLTTGPLAPAEIPAAATVTLNQVIFASLHGHPVIGAELESIQQAQADYLKTTLLPNPQLFADAQLLPLTKPFTVTRQGGPPQQDVILTYPIDWFLFGKRTAAMNSAHFGVHITQAEFENMVRLRVVTAAEAFYSALEAKALLQAATENVDNLRRVDTVTQSAVENGGRPSIELSRVRLDVLAAEQRQRTAAAAAARTTAAQLRAVMGESGVPISLDPEGDLGTNFATEPLSSADAYELAKIERPDLKAIQWRMTKAGADIELERRAARPTMAPSVGYTRQYQQKAIGFPDADSWSASLNMSVPIFDRNQGNIAKAEAIQRRAHFGYQVALLDVQAEVEEAVAELRAARENAKSVSEEQLLLAAKVRDSIVESYETGGRTLIEVLDAQRNYRETYLLYVTARATYWRALYRYYSVIGREVAEQ